MQQGITQRISQESNGDRLDLTDLLEISDLLLRHNTFCFQVAGWSMYPALQKGDRLTVEPVSPAKLQVGDLLLFHHRGRLICHRLVAMNQTGPVLTLITKGDAVAGFDPPLQPSQVLGKVVGIRRCWWWAGKLAMRTDRWRERLICQIAQGFEGLQGLRSYRRFMRTLLSRCFAYYVGIPEGRRWYRYHRVRRGGNPPCGGTSGVLKGQQRFHLVAKLAGTCVGSLHVEARAEGYWLQALSVRIRWRGLGVASQLLALACDVAALSEARRLLAAIEEENNAARRLLEKMRFHPLPSINSSDTSVLVRELERAEAAASRCTGPCGLG